MRVLRILSFTLVMTGLTSCNDGTLMIPATGCEDFVTISPNPVPALTSGGSRTLIASVHLNCSGLTERAVTWSVLSGTDVVDLTQATDTSVVVVGRNAGTAVVSVTAKAKSDVKAAVGVQVN